MQQYLLNLEKGDLHQMLDPREVEKANPSDRVIRVMTLEEFSEDKTIPHTTGFIRNLQHHSACKLEMFSDCVQGIMRVPRRSSGNLSEMQIGFYLDDDQLLFIEDNGFLLPFLKTIEKTPLGSCTLSYVVLCMLGALIEDDALDLERLEDKLAKIEENLLRRIPDSFYATVIAYRRELTALRAFYEQMMNIGDQMQAYIDMELDSREQAGWKLFVSRCDRLHSHVEMLKEYLLQIRELYQSQIEVQQNRIMTFLTIVTTIFMPLTLIAGWFGMNFPNMLMFQWKYGYLFVIVLSVSIVVAEFFYFRRKKML
ncbi:MAG: CorA family divalent cation transporter [Acutalibacteraceae bacterium]